MTYNGVANNAMSAWFCIITVAGPVFRDVYEETSSTVFLLPDLLRRLVTLVYKWPSPAVEGVDGDARYDCSTLEHQLQYQHVVAEAGIRFLHAARREYEAE